MKILMVGPYPIDGNIENIDGGVQAVVVNMIKGLSGFKDMDIHVLTANSCINKEQTVSSDMCKIYTVPLDKHFGNITLYFKTRQAITKKIREIVPDLVHTHMFGYYTLACLDSGHKNILVSTHGITSGRWGISYGIVERMRRYLQDYTYLRCAKRAKRLIVNSQYAIKALEDFKYEHIYRLDNAVADVFFKDMDCIRGKERVLFVGNVCKAKGIMTLLKAVETLKKDFSSLKVVIAGQTLETDFYNEAKNFIKDRDLAGIIEFTGQLDDNRLTEEYKKASVFAFPSNQDVAPLAVLQAMSSGTPIVTTRVGGIPYMVEDQKEALLVDKNDYNALSEKISLLLKDPVLRERISNSARQKATKNNQISSVAEKLYKIYKEAMLNNG